MESNESLEAEQLVRHEVGSGCRRGCCGSHRSAVRAGVTIAIAIVHAITSRGSREHGASVTDAWSLVLGSREAWPEAISMRRYGARGRRHEVASRKRSGQVKYSKRFKPGNAQEARPARHRIWTFVANISFAPNDSTSTCSLLMLPAPVLSTCFQYRVPARDPSCRREGVRQGEGRSRCSRQGSYAIPCRKSAARSATVASANAASRASRTRNHTPLRA